MNEPQQLMYYLPPIHNCQNGACWRCLQAPQTGYFEGRSTIESCSPTGKYNPADVKKNFTKWIIKESGNLGPDGIKLFDLYGHDVQSGHGDVPVKFYSDVVFAGIQATEGVNTNDIIRKAGTVYDNYIIFNPCDGKMLVGLADDITMREAPAYLGTGEQPGTWTIRDPYDVNEKDNNFPIN